MKAAPAPDGVRDPLSLFDVDGKVALVVGASGAFGQVASRALAAAGARLVLATGSRERLERLGAAIEDEGRPAVLVNRRHDTEEDADAMVDAAVAAYGELDIVVIASGTGQNGKTVVVWPQELANGQFLFPVPAS